jgi:hypothetical protein
MSHTGSLSCLAPSIPFLFLSFPRRPLFHNLGKSGQSFDSAQRIGRELLGQLLSKTTAAWQSQ